VAHSERASSFLRCPKKHRERGVARANVPRGESPPIDGAPDPTRHSRQERPGEGRVILGTGPGRKRSVFEARQPRQRMMRRRGRVDSDRSRERSGSEIPRPSSRETAPPPYWASSRDGVAGNRLCRAICKESLTLKGPRRAQAWSQLAENIGPSQRLRSNLQVRLREFRSQGRSKRKLSRPTR